MQVKPYAGRRWGRLLLLVAIAASVFSLFPLERPAAAASGAQRTIRIEASQYQFSPGAVDVRRGDEVTIELVATDVVHGLALDGYGLEMRAEPGQTARLTFVADRAGTFRFRCSVSCGAMHPFMIGKLRVGNNLLLWTGLGLALLVAAGGLVRARKVT